MRITFNGEERRCGGAANERDAMNRPAAVVLRFISSVIMYIYISFFFLLFLCHLPLRLSRKTLHANRRSRGARNVTDRANPGAWKIPRGILRLGGISLSLFRRITKNHEET